MNYKKKVQDILNLAGITLNGDKPWDIKVHNERFYSRVLRGGSLALGESYMDGWWDVDSLDQFFDKVLRARLDKKVANFSTALYYLTAKLFNFQSEKRSYQVGEEHYDIGNDLYVKMLGSSMAYSCGYWKDANDLDSAQYAKLDLICRKMGLRSGMKVLEIGCGWGSFMKFAAEKYGVEIVGLTVSKEQIKLGEELCKGLPVEFKLMDYRNMTGSFDRIISIGMFEHVGPKNYEKFMEVAERCLKDDGLLLLHTIGRNSSVPGGDPWIHKYIFPNGVLPSVAQISSSAEDKLVLEDFHNFGAYYDLTLMAWFKRFNDSWDSIKNKYSERFYRMWKFYLLSCAGAFRARDVQLWQFVFSKKGVAGIYETVR